MANYCDILENFEEGFVDLTFDVIKEKKKLLGNLFLDCVASYEGKDIGFTLEVKNNMQGVINNDFNNIKFYKDGLKISYLPGYSDGFEESIVKLYGFEPVNLVLKDELILEVCCLRGNPSDLSKGEVQFKCFAEANNQERYAEFFINIDLVNKKVYLREKSPEYRANIILFFGKVEN